MDIRDSELLSFYHQGFKDELNSVEKKKFFITLNQRAYDLGCVDAIVGDDVKSVDYQSDEEILKKIKNNSK